MKFQLLLLSCFAFLVFWWDYVFCTKWKTSTNYKYCARLKSCQGWYYHVLSHSMGFSRAGHQCWWYLYIDMLYCRVVPWLGIPWTARTVRHGLLVMVWCGKVWKIADTITLLGNPALKLCSLHLKIAWWSDTAEVCNTSHMLYVDYGGLWWCHTHMWNLC